jgi:hypothetical protein
MVLYLNRIVQDYGNGIKINSNQCNFQENQGRRESRVLRVSLAPLDKMARRENVERKDWGSRDQR